MLSVLTAAISVAPGCGSGYEQDEYCEGQKLPCKTLEEMREDFTYWDGTGEIISVDDGPRLDIDYQDGTGSCCYTVTYKSEYGMG